MLVLGLLLIIGACAVGITGVLGNRGAGHQVAGGFDAVGRTMHGSAGQLFFWGIVVGGVAMLGLALLLTGLRGDIRRRGAARRGGVQARNGEHEALTDDASLQAGRIPAHSTTKHNREVETAQADADRDAVADAD